MWTGEGEERLPAAEKGKGGGGVRVADLVSLGLAKFGRIRRGGKREEDFDGSVPLATAL